MDAQAHTGNHILSSYFDTQQALQRAYLNHTCSICREHTGKANGIVSAFLKRTT